MKDPAYHRFRLLFFLSNHVFSLSRYLANVAKLSHAFMSHHFFMHKGDSSFLNNWQVVVRFHFFHLFKLFEVFIIISYSCIWFVWWHSMKRCWIELFFCFPCTVPGAGFLGVPVWWQHGSETRNRLQDDSSAAEHPGAVGCMAWQCDDASTEALWRQTQFS